ncbi:MAG: MmgE/PrpD family protein [Caldilineaceae bacterium]
MDLPSFIHTLTWQDLPVNVQHQARRCLLDTIGTAIGGRQTPVSRIIHDFAAAVYGGQSATLWFDGRTASPPGAALANATTIDALDLHDGHPLTKGHAGVAVIPAAFAFLQGQPISGRELLTRIVIGYEIALGAGIALHATACDYHTSGAWNALGCAAVGARHLRLSVEQTRHALGIAEYNGPRSQMMRCIDHPTMVKDGSGWGAMTGVSAALLAQAGFTGAPALTVETADIADLWADLGQRWRMLEQYIKPHAVCRWAQPAIEGALNLQQTYQLQPEQIERIAVYTFHNAVRLDVCRPVDTEAAQYSLPFPVAAALVHGKLGGAQLTGNALTDPRVLRLAERVELSEEPEFQAQFPARRFARVQIETSNGERYDSGPVEAKWNAEEPPTDDELRAKFRWIAGEVLPTARVQALETALWQCADYPDARAISALLAQAVR